MESPTFRILPKRTHPFKSAAASYLVPPIGGAPRTTVFNAPHSTREALRNIEGIAQFADHENVSVQRSAPPFHGEDRDFTKYITLVANADLKENESNVRFVNVSVEKEGPRRNSYNWISAEIANVITSGLAMFILQKIVLAEQVNIETLARNLGVPRGWIAFASLCRAGLIDILDEHTILPTSIGFQVHELFQRTAIAQKEYEDGEE